MILPTPGANGPHGPVGQHNVMGALGFTSPPTFSTSSSSPGLYEAQTVTAILQTPVNGGSIHFTTNSANPTRYSELYDAPLTANRTVIIRAIAAREGYIPSRSITRSYLFKENILGTAPQGTIPTNHQGARDGQNQFLGLLRGYPEQTDGGPTSPMLYGMDAATIAAKKATLSQELSAAPVVSLVCTVPDFFDLAAGGLYANSSQTAAEADDPRARNWQRLCSFEFIETDKSAFIQANACLLITGGSSIANITTRKHSLRVEFNSVHGDKKLLYPLFPDFNGIEFHVVHLKNALQDSWANTYGPIGALNGQLYSVSDRHLLQPRLGERRPPGDGARGTPSALGASFHQRHLLGSAPAYRTG